MSSASEEETTDTFPLFVDGLEYQLKKAAESDLDAGQTREDLYK
jgi:hypothetical protein